MTDLTSDVGVAMIASDAWGTREVLRACAGLAREQFHRSFPIGLGSLHDTLTHMVSTMRRWTDRLAEREPRPMLHTVPEYPHLSGETRERTPAELLALLDDAERDLRAVYRAEPAWLASTLSLDWPGDQGRTMTYTFTRAAVIAHVTSHGYHHRAQCLNILRHVGAPVPGVTKGWPEASAVDWQAAVERPPAVR